MPQVETIEEAPKAEKPPFEAALTQIETIKTTYRDAIRGLNDLTDLLKQAARDSAPAKRNSTPYGKPCGHCKASAFKHPTHLATETPGPGRK